MGEEPGRGSGTERDPERGHERRYDDFAQARMAAGPDRSWPEHEGARMDPGAPDRGAEQGEGDRTRTDQPPAPVSRARLMQARAAQSPVPDERHDEPDDEFDDDDDFELGDGRNIRNHSHDHGKPPPVSARTRRIVMAILIPAILATAAGMFLLWPGAVDRVTGQPAGYERAYGDVVLVTTTACPTANTGSTSNQPCGEANVRVNSGPGSGKTVTVPLPRGPGAPTVAEGDQVVLAFIADAPEGSDAYSIMDHQRGQPMLYMLAMCGAIIIVFGRWRGLTAIIGLGVSFGVLLYFVIPGILNGESPLTVAIVGSAAIMFAVLYLTHGINVHTSVAILGTLAALVITGLLGAAFTATTKLTGFGSEETMYLSVMQGNVDMRGLLLAGIIIGALGVLDDLTVSQAATVAELSTTARSRLDVYRAATRVGRAHVASAVNTIVLAYAGTSLPLLLIVAAGGSDISDLLTSQFLAQEIVRSAVGTIGLVAAVPITTALATLVADIRPRRRPRP